MLAIENIHYELYTHAPDSEYELRALYILLTIQRIKETFSLYQSKQNLKQSFRGEKFSVSYTELLNPYSTQVGLLLLKSLNVEALFSWILFLIDLNII